MASNDAVGRADSNEYLFVHHKAEPAENVTLSPVLLSHRHPKGTFQVRVDDVSHVKSERSFWGIKSIAVYSRGRGTPCIVQPIQPIGDLHRALLKLLIERPHFHGVRDSISDDPARWERLVWMTAQTETRGEHWLALHASNTIPLDVVVTERGLIALDGRTDDWKLSRIDWQDLLAWRCRPADSILSNPHTRFYLKDRIEELETMLGDDPFATVMDNAWNRARGAGSGAAAEPYALGNVKCVDNDLAFNYSWELEGLGARNLLKPGEIVIACAFGRGKSQVFSDAVSGAETYGKLGLHGAAYGMGFGLLGSALNKLKTKQIFLTSEKLILLTSDPLGTEVDLVHVEDLKQRVLCSGNQLKIGDFALDVFERCGLNTASDFVARYERYVLAPRAKPPAAPAAAPEVVSGAPAVSQRLKDLHELYKAGVIDEDEYKTKKASLLAQL